MNVGFFASDDEQRQWLAQLATRYDGWCVADNLEGGLVVGSLAEAGELFASSGQPGRRLFIGRSDLSAGPVGLDATRPWPIDMVRSLAVQFVPAYVSGTDMVEGRLDINKASDFSDQQHYKRLRRWMSELVRSIAETLHVEGVDLVLASVDGTRSPPGGRHVVSGDAIEWTQHGGSLRQFVQGTFSFEPVRRA